MNINKAYKEQETQIQKGIALLVEQPANTQEMIKIMNRLNYLKGVLSANQELNRTEGETPKSCGACTKSNNGSPADIMVCCCCGEEDETYTAYCSNCGRVPHKVI